VPERGWPGGEATAAAAGTLAPQAEIGLGDPLLPLGIAARDHYAELVAQLERDGAENLGHRACGVALVACDEARAAELRAQVAAQRALGLEAEWLDRAALLKRHPGIGPEALGALLAPRDGAIDNVALAAALLASGARAGVEFAESEEVFELLLRGGRIAGVRTSRMIRETDTVVLAAGAWSPSIRGLPRALRIMPARGQMALVPWPGGEPDAVLFGRQTYALRRGDGAVLGSTMEWAGFEPVATEEGMDRIRRETGALLPALLGQPVRKRWAGLRPMTPDGRPIIGRDPEVEGLFYATGHGRNGILLGPLTGEIIRDLVVQGETPYDLTPFAVQRFQPEP
jgi:glycine oxidase